MTTLCPYNDVHSVNIIILIQKPDQCEDFASKDDTDNTEGIPEYCTCENYDYCWSQNG